MKLIAHRGLSNGPNKLLENTTSSISQCLEQGLDAEIDVWWHEGKWFLGHDAPCYAVPKDFILQPGLWIHAKNFEACIRLQEFPTLNYFWHENDERTLTSHGFWWTFPKKTLGVKSVAVMPEWYIPIEQLAQCLEWNVYGICTDWISRLK